MNKFVIITTVYNVAKWLPININTLKMQSYDNWECILIDDHSTDGSFELCKRLSSGDDRFSVIQTAVPNGGQGDAFLHAIDSFQFDDEDVVVEVDGDDWLSSVFVLQYLAAIYELPNVWMTYGQYQIYPTGKLGGHYTMDIRNDVDSANLHRNAPFPYSHLKTYKYHLLSKLNREHLIDPNTGRAWSKAWDHALCLPMVEMAGKDRIHRCDDILYVLNRADELQNEGKVSVKEQKEIEQKIRSLPRYDKL